MERLHFDCAWTGTVEDGMMGPGSPRMKATGRARFAWTDDGLWLRGEFAPDQVADGRLVLRWSAHYLVGWELRAGDHVAFMADNCGHAGFMRGSINGERMVLTTPAADPVKFRITWDVSNRPLRPGKTRCRSTAGRGS